MHRCVAMQVLSGFAATLATVAMLATDVSAQTLSPNSDATATLAAGVLYKNFANSGQSARVVVFPAPCCALTTSGGTSWPASSGITITYNGINLSTTAAGATTTRSVGPLGNLNYIEITIAKQANTTSVALNSIALNGGSSLGSAAVSTAPNTQVWKITGANLTAGFTLTGTLSFNGLHSSSDNNYVLVQVGYVPPADSEGPVTSSVATSPIPAILNGPVTVSANVNDEMKGNNNIASAEYEVNDGGWAPMSASDSAFDSPYEDVEATFTATAVGNHQVCVKGSDALGNVGTAACQMFLVTYNFTGFLSPIDNAPVNLARAGQAIPVKWRLTDANDLPIEDAASFVSLWSYPISCTTLAGDPVDSIEEVSSGSSGLQYAGDGYWQFNWKTPKNYVDTCRAMYVEFNSGHTPEVVKFKFRK